MDQKNVQNDNLGEVRGQEFTKDGRIYWLKRKKVTKVSS